MFDCKEKLLDDVSDYDEVEVDVDTSDDVVIDKDYTFKNLVELAETFAMTRSEKDFTNLYNASKKRLCKHIRKIVGINNDDINTVLDNTMILIYCNIDKYDSDKSKFHTWMYTIARNEAISYLRKGAIHNSNIIKTDFSDLYDSSVMVDDTIFESNDGPLSYVSEDEGFLDIVYDNGKYITYTKEYAIDTFFGAVRDAISSMSDAHKIVFKERLFKNKKVNDVAMLVGVTDRSVKRYYANSKKMLCDYVISNNPHVYELIKEIY